MPKYIDINYIKQYALRDKTICNSNIYINNKTKLSFTCNQNHIYEMTWSNFKKEQRCRYCKFNIPSIEFIKSYAKQDGSTCISNSYKNNRTKLTFVCSKRNHIYDTVWSSFYNKNARCQKCHILDLSDIKTGSNHWNWNPDRTRKSRLKNLSFNNRKFKLLENDILYNEFIKHKGNGLKNIYQIDHIYPRVAFIDNNLDKIYGIKICKYICNLQENLQILKYQDNRKKWFNYNEDEFIKWFNLKLKEIQ